MAGQVKTYDPKKVIVTFGGNSITGFVEGTFVQISTQGDGVTGVVGCDQEIVRSIDPGSILKNITINLLQSSDSNDTLSKIQDSDNQRGDGIKAMIIKDLSGRTIMSADSAWIVKKPDISRGRSASDGACQWVFQAVVEDSSFLVGGHT